MNDKGIFRVKASFKVPDREAGLEEDTRPIVAYLVTDHMTSYDFKRHFVVLADDNQVESLKLDTRRFSLKPLVEQIK